MKILIITQRWYPDTFGGSEHVASKQARRLAERGHKVTVLTEYTQAHLPPEEPLAPAFSIEGRGVEGEGEARIIRYGQPEQFQKWGSSLIDVKILPKLVKELHLKNKFEAAILHNAYPAYGFFKAKLNIPSLYIFHASTAREAEIEGLRRKFKGFIVVLRPLMVKVFIFITRQVEKKVLRRAKKIAVFSDFSLELLQATYPQPKDKITKIKVGIDAANFYPPQDKKEAKKRLGFSPERPIVLTVRRLTARMGLHELLYAALQIREQFPNALFLIIGEGPLRESLTNEIDQLNLRGFVTFVGKVPLKELPLYYQAADLFVLPTAAFEGLGMATLEALASGLPVVGTPVGATPEILKKIDSSLITKSEKADGIAEGIMNFLNRPEGERSLLGQKCREAAEREYDWEEATGELEEILKQLI